MMAALIGLVALGASCGDDDSQSAPVPAAAGSDAESTDGSDGSDAASGATGAPSDWYSDLDPLEVPTTGDALLTVGGQPTDIEITWCEFKVADEYVTELPAQTNGDSFTAEAQLRGTLVGGQPYNLNVRRSVNPGHTGDEPYEIDTLQFSVDDGSDIRVMSRATMMRTESGGPATGDGGTLPMIKVSGTTLTSVGAASVLLSAAGDYELAVVEPFELAVSCP